MPILSYILFEQEDDGYLRLTASDLDSTIVERVPVHFQTEPTVPGRRIAVPGSYLLSTVRNLGDVPIDFEADENFALTVRAGPGQYQLSGLDGADYPILPTQGEMEPHFVIARSVLTKAVEKAGFAVSTSKQGSALSGILFQMFPDHLRLVGTDSVRLVLFKALEVPCREEGKWVLPVGGLKGLTRMSGGEYCRVTMGKEHATFDFDTSRLVTRVMDAPFPNYEAVLPKDNERTLRANRELFWAATRRTMPFAGSAANQIRLDIKDGELKISAEDIERAHKAFELIPCEFEDKEDSDGTLVLAYNSKYLLGVLQHLESEEVVFEVGNPEWAGTMRPAINYPGEDLLMLLMPVMLRKYSS